MRKKLYIDTGDNFKEKIMYGMPIGDLGNFCCGGYGYGNGMQAFGPMTSPMGGGNSIFNMNNCAAPQGLMTAFNQGSELGLRIRISSMINNNNIAISNLNSMEVGFENLLKSDKLDETQKAKIQAALEKIKAKREEFQNKFKNIDVKNLNVEELEALQTEIQNTANEVQEVQKEAAEIASEITKAIEEKAKQEAEQAANGDSTASSDGTASSGSASGSTTTVGEGDDAIDVDSETGRPASLGEKPSRSDLATTCLQIRQSITCSGTKHDVLDPIIQGLDKTDIVEVIQYWEENYNKEDKEKESFFRKIFADVGDDWQSDNVPLMRKALAERAEALGIGDEVEAELAKADMELTKGPSAKKLWFGSYQDDKTIADGLMAAYNKIVEKEKSNATAAKDKVAETKAKADEAKTEEKAKAEEEKRQKYEDFRNDMFQYWNITDEDAIMVNVYYENGKYRAHVNGKDYYGNSFREVLDAIKNAKDTDESGKEIDPKKFLIGKANN